MSVCLCVCMHSTLYNCAYACESIHVNKFKSNVVRVSFMCWCVLNLSVPRLPEAGFYMYTNLKRYKNRVCFRHALLSLRTASHERV